jgi:hypothetical protein
MKKQYSFIFSGLFLIGLWSSTDSSVETQVFEDYVLEDNSSNPPLGNTGAPGESSCVTCHSGSTLPAAGVVEFNFDGSNNSYVPGQTYTISISSTGNSKNGFQMTALDGTSNAAGTFTAGTASSVGTANGRRYIRHSTSNNTSSWIFQWTAPSEGQGDVTFYYSYAKANGAGGNTGDQIYLGNATIQQDVASTVEPVQNKNVVDISVVNSDLLVSYSLNQSANIYLCAQDVNGRQLFYQDYGMQSAGVYTQRPDPISQLSSGIYFITLFVDNHPYTAKIFLP